jgi:DNA-binding MarR family transcriptional regulator
MSATYNDRFVLLPLTNQLSKDGLHYKDLLTYITIRSFNNADIDYCIPSLNTISDRSGMNKKTIMQSINRLEKSGMLKVTKSDKKRVSNVYKFPICKVFYQIPYEVFNADDLTYSQKAMLVFMRQCFDSINLEAMSTNIRTWVFILGVSYKTLYTQFVQLVAKGYIEKYTKTSRSGYKRLIVRLTDKLNWKYYRNLPEPKQYFSPGPLLFK